MGSVAWSMRHFADGVLSARNFERAEIAAKAVLDDAVATHARAHWDAAYGSSGTVGAVADALRLAGRAAHDGAITRGGLAVLRALFDLLGIERLRHAHGALRHGALVDLLDREREVTDVRASSVEHLAARFGADAQQAGRVARVGWQRWLAMAVGFAGEAGVGGSLPQGAAATRRGRGGSRRPGPRCLSGAARLSLPWGWPS